jgi:hypothetical protein
VYVSDSHHATRYNTNDTTPNTNDIMPLRPSPEYAKEMLTEYNKQVHVENAKLKEVIDNQTNTVIELKKALAATKMKLVAEQQLSFDMRFERDEAIDYTCYMLQRMYHDGFSGALKMFTEEYGWIKYSGRCTSPLITNDDDFVDVVANGYTAYSSTVAQEDSVTEHVIDLTTDVNYMQ